jgi:predicted permease
VLLIAVTNLAGLLLARGAARQREFAVRAALGAGRGRIVRLLVTESVLLAVLGGALGAVFAQWGTGFLTQFLAQTMVPVKISPDGRVLLFTLGVSLLTGVLFGLAPAWRLSRLDLVSAIKDQSQGATAGRISRLQPSLVVAQVALSVLLLAGAGLFARTLRHLQTVELGFTRDNLLSFGLETGRWRPTAAEQTALLRQVLAELPTLPGVNGASVAGAGLLTGNGMTMDFVPEGYVAAPEEEISGRVILAGPDFFATMGVPIVQGRAFLPTDEPPSPADGKLPPPRATIVGERLAQKYFPGVNPVGRILTLEGGKRLEIVGVAKDTRYTRDLRAAVPIQFYVPFFGSDLRMPTTIYVRTTRSAAVAEADVRRVLSRVDSRLTPHNLRSMDETIDRLLVRERIIAQLVGFFSAFALLLTGLGIYGILAFRVAQRTRDIGIRIALGATIRDVVRLVLAQGLSLTFLGALLGIGGALAGTRFLGALLYGVTPTDRLTFVVVIGLLLVVAGVACWLPARRATKVDPMVALRAE